MALISRPHTMPLNDLLAPTAGAANPLDAIQARLPTATTTVSASTDPTTEDPEGSEIDAAAATAESGVEAEAEAGVEAEDAP